MYIYFQREGGEEKWSPVLNSHKAEIISQQNPTFTTVLAVNKLVDDLPHEERLKLKYLGPFYADFDSSSIAEVIPKFHSFLAKLEAMKFDLNMARLFITGGKGMHIEIPEECFLEKPSKDGTQALPTIFREMALDLYVDTLDLRVYSQGRGRMWRCPGKIRPNGKHKVSITLAEAWALTEESYDALCSTPREQVFVKQPSLCLDLAICYAKAAQKVDEKVRKRLKSKPDPNAKARANGPSIGLMMMGCGIKEGSGFQHIAMQLAIAANTCGTSEEDFLLQCEGLIENHQGDGSRYGTPARRREELRRMLNYTHDNPLYEFSVGAVKVLLTHAAPDLDGVTVSTADIEETIKEAAEAGLDTEPDEYADVAAGITLTKYGVYVESEFGKKRVCAVSFSDTCILLSTDSGQIIAYSTDILVNGKKVGREDLELDVFQSCLNFNKFCAKRGHAYSGSDLQLRGVFMRFIEQAKKKGTVAYVTKREGIDVISIPGHADPELQKPFLTWSDSRGVLTDPRAAQTGINLKFLGFPDPRGTFQTDLADAPKLYDWIKEEGNRAALKRTLNSLFTCQEPAMLGKQIGWFVACFWRMLFHKAHSKFPSLHVVGPAGNGKTEGCHAMLSLFYYNTEPKTMTASSSIFAIQQQLSGSSSIPLMLDEYKLETMQNGKHGNMKAMIREVYNCHTVTKGGGSRENDDYRVLHGSQLSAPLFFIAEAAEEESAVMERVVLLTVTKPPSSLAARRYTLFKVVQDNRKHLSILGQYLTAKILSTYSVEKLREEFDPMYEEARVKYMLTEADEGKQLTAEELQNKQAAKERTVYNYTVPKFGFRKFRELVNVLLDGELDEVMGKLENAIYDRMTDLQRSTQAEYLKVLSLMSTMTYTVEDGRPEQLRKGVDYAFSNLGGKDVVELSARIAYIKYRQFCRSAGLPGLFNGYESFVMALKDSSICISQSPGKALRMPGVFHLDVNELARAGVEPFKA